MFGLGVPEIAIIAVLALVLFGPKKIPELFRGLGQGLKYFKQEVKSVEAEVKSVTDEATK